jgi:uncharacterized protein
MLIVIKTENLGFYVKFNDNSSAVEVFRRLPLDGVVSKWGDEIYFKADVPIPSADPTMDVNVGDIAYWPQGKCICVFFGRTPASTTDKPVPEGPVIVIGHTLANPQELREIKSGEPIRFFMMGMADDYFKDGNPYEDNRKLSQKEIDVLVKQVLAEKRYRSN